MPWCPNGQCFCSWCVLTNPYKKYHEYLLEVISYRHDRIHYPFVYVISPCLLSTYKYSLDIYTVSSTGAKALHATLMDNPEQMWKRRLVDVKRAGSHQFVFEVFVASQDKFEVSLDDIQVMDGNCSTVSQSQKHMWVMLHDDFLCHFFYLFEKGNISNVSTSLYTIA